MLDTGVRRRFERFNTMAVKDKITVKLYGGPQDGHEMEVFSDCMWVSFKVFRAPKRRHVYQRVTGKLRFVYRGIE